jgi:hypothetical protein
MQVQGILTVNFISVVLLISIRESCKYIDAHTLEPTFGKDSRCTLKIKRGKNRIANWGNYLHLEEGKMGC